MYGNVLSVCNAWYGVRLNPPTCAPSHQASQRHRQIRGQTQCHASKTSTLTLTDCTTINNSTIKRMVGVFSIYLVGCQPVSPTTHVLLFNNLRLLAIRMQSWTLTMCSTIAAPPQYVPFPRCIHYLLECHHNSYSFVSQTLQCLHGKTNNDRRSKCAEFGRLRHQISCH